jgi:hypothetical protein
LLPLLPRAAAACVVDSTAPDTRTRARLPAASLTPRNFVIQSAELQCLAMPSRINGGSE